MVGAQEYTEFGFDKDSGVVAKWHPSWCDAYKQFPTKIQMDLGSSAQNNNCETTGDSGCQGRGSQTSMLALLGLNMSDSTLGHAWFTLAKKKKKKKKNTPNGESFRTLFDWQALRKARSSADFEIMEALHPRLFLGRAPAWTSSSAKRYLQGRW